MRELFPRLFIGDLDDCKILHFPDMGAGDYAILHAAKSPCHTDAVNYKGKLARDHPNYLMLERGDNLYLNMIDGPMLPAEFGNPLFKASMLFIDKQLSNPDKKILVHCNKGNSRAPSIALAYAARKGLINALSYEMARLDFLEHYALYMPGEGVAHYLENNWNTVMSF